MTATLTIPGTYEPTTPATHRPAWATTHREEAGGITWEHNVFDGEDGDRGEVVRVGVDLSCQDSIAFDNDGELSLRRGPTRVIVGDDDITPEAARQLRDDLAEALRLLEA